MEKETKTSDGPGSLPTSCPGRYRTNLSQPLQQLFARSMTMPNPLTQSYFPTGSTRLRRVRRWHLQHSPRTGNGLEPMSWLGSAWPVFWRGLFLAWRDLAWCDLAWCVGLALAWLGLAWLGLAWPGFGLENSSQLELKLFCTKFWNKFNSFDHVSTSRPYVLFCFFCFVSKISFHV